MFGSEQAGTIARRTLLTWMGGAAILAGVGQALAVAAIAPGTDGRPAGDRFAAYHRYADAAVQSFLLKYWNPARNGLNASYPENGRLTGYWTYANGWRTVIANAARTRGRRYLGLIESFYQGQKSRGWHVDFYDDENWMALALLDAHEVTREARYLQEAKTLFSDLRQGWDTSCCGAAPGGIWWDRRHTQKATASNAGPVIAACRLYQETRDPSYLEFARKLYGYWWEQMVDPATYRVADHINRDGTKVWWRFTYNEGLMIGASQGLYRATHDPAYLENAHRVARFMVGNEVTPSRYGPVLFDGTNDACRGDVTSSREWPSTTWPKLSGRARTRLRRGASGQRRCPLEPGARAIPEPVRRWTGPARRGPPPPRRSRAPRRPRCARLPACRASLPTSRTPRNRYEAEDAAFHSLGPEARYGGFSGWGYVAGWNAPGRPVGDVPAARAIRTHQLTFRYAAGAGDARRVLVVNGRQIGASLRFPGTGSWEAYRTVSVRVRLHGGVNRVQVAYDLSWGSRNFLNLDRVVVERSPRRAR